ncbi:hypothetical protein Gotri_016442 [Gossypium trilobum]|uniref:Uncharacterized protein n=1 Tax=Gossypium trilobum TaxID=34281 RepID=A0A7J9E3Q6_9ROSI|nr:hypothetical protein [Gossypium trilobum]
MTKLSFTICADVDLSSATLVEPSGVTRNQHVPVQYGMSLTLYIIDKGGNDVIVRGRNREKTMNSLLSVVSHTVIPFDEKGSFGTLPTYFNIAILFYGHCFRFATVL